MQHIDLTGFFLQPLFQLRERRRTFDRHRAKSFATAACVPSKDPQAFQTMRRRSLGSTDGSRRHRYAPARHRPPDRPRLSYRAAWRPTARRTTSYTADDPEEPLTV